MVKRKTKENVITEALNAKANEDMEVVSAKVEEKKASEKDTVIVYCAIPMGLTMSDNGGNPWMLKGLPVSHLVSATTGGYLPAGKYGETVMPKAKWEELLEKYKMCDFIQNGAVFAKSSAEEGREVARENSKHKLGFEQVDTKKTKTQKAEKDED